MSESLTNSIFNRVEILIGQKGLEKLRNSHVAIFGAGAVGSFAAENLVRSGIGEMTIIDFDTINKTNINRQLGAMHSSLGLQKTEVLSVRFIDINPDLKIHTVNQFVDTENLNNMNLSNFSYIIDAIDSFTPKLNLLRICLESDLPIISSMGAAGKINPTKIRIDWLGKTNSCPLARRLRKFLRRFNVNFDTLLTVFSTEVPFKPVPPDETFEELTIERGRRRNVSGSICHIPAIFGSYIAAIVIQAILEKKRIPGFVNEALGKN